jgi:hypothetical protein
LVNAQKDKIKDGRIFPLLKTIRIFKKYEQTLKTDYCHCQACRCNKESTVHRLGVGEADVVGGTSGLEQSTTISVCGTSAFA